MTINQDDYATEDQYNAAVDHQTIVNTLIEEAEALHHHHRRDDDTVIEHSHPWDETKLDVSASLPTHSHDGHYGACAQDCRGLNPVS